MARIREFLEAEDYKNYRNVRAAALMFIIIGGVVVIGGSMVLLVSLFVEPTSDNPPPPLLLGVLLPIFGLTGVIGGGAILGASAKWSKLAYVMAALYVLAFPIGTILSLVIFTGLGRYLKDVSRFQRAQQPAAG